MFVDEEDKQDAIVIELYKNNLVGKLVMQVMIKH